METAVLRFGGIGRLAGRLLHHRGGNFGIMAALTTPMLVLAAGYAVNIGQVTVTKSNLLAALDSAVTSTARDLTTGAITEEEAPRVVEAFLIANGLRAYAETGKLHLDSLVIDRTAKTVTAKASVDLDVAFALFGTANRQKITAESAAIYSDKKIEVAMMLDVTGSMKANKGKKTDKIGDLKTAASNAVTQLLGSNRAGGDRIRVAIVPYAEAVNVGKLAARTVFDEKTAGNVDLPPPLDAPYWVSLPARTDNCATERKLRNGSPDFTDLNPYDETTRKDNDNKNYRALVNRDNRLKAANCPSAEVVPLTADRQKLLDAIDAFTANGYTAGGIAAQWGYYMLSPNWRQAVVDSGLGNGPADFDARKVSKIAILMTDGEFNTVFAGGTAGKDPQGEQQKPARDNAEGVCRNMKTDGIEIFTIGFALPSGESNNARSVLRNCATTDTSSIRHFHEASTGDELDAVFKEIVRNIEGLALTK